MIITAGQVVPLAEYLCKECGKEVTPLPDVFNIGPPDSVVCKDCVPVYKEKKAVQRIKDALLDKGIAPAYHDAQLRKLEKEWPVLFKALQALVPYNDLGGHIG